MKTRILILFSIISTLFLSCKNSEERVLIKASKKYIKETKPDIKSVVYISEYESDSVLKVFRISSILVTNQIEITSYRKIKRFYLLFSLQNKKSIPLPKNIMDQIKSDPDIIYDPVQWAVLKCKSSNKYLIIKNVNYQNIADLNEYKSFYEKCNNLK